jgi:hypothetical protein
MNFLGSVGAVMSRSGIEELFEELTMENLSHHLMYGKYMQDLCMATC